MTKQRNETILPREHGAAVSRHGLGWTIVLALVVVIAVNASVDALFEQRPELQNPTYRAFDAQWRRLVSLDEPVGTLILGDSSGRHGVDPRVLGEALDTRAINLCTIGNAGVVNAAWQLEAYVERFGAPERVVFVAVHDLWKREISAPLLPWVRLPWGFWSSMDATIAMPRDVLGDMLLTRYAPIYAQNQTVSGLAMRPWEAGRERIDFDRSGFSPIGRARPDHVRSDAADQLKWGVPGGWSAAEQSARAFEAMVALATREGFALYVVPGPLYEGLATDPAFVDYDTRRREWIHERTEGHPGVHAVLEPPPTYPAERMQNSDHVAGDASVDYTRRIAAAIRAVEGSPGD